MKGYLAAVILALGCGSPVFGAGGPASAYYQTQNTTNPPVVDATAFVNSATMEFSITANQVNEGDFFTGGAIQYATHDTLYTTNTASGQMICQTGFNFETITETTIHPESQFVNEGVITAVDIFGVPLFYEYNGGSAVLTPGTGIPVPSYLSVSATNIFNKGTMSVGADGAMKMVGRTLTNSSGALVAGDLTGNDLFDLTSLQETYDESVNGTLAFRYFVEPPSLNEVYWGATNGTLALNVYGNGIGRGDTPPQPITGRSSGTGFVTLPLNGDVVEEGTTNIILGNAAEYATYIYTYPQPNQLTNFYYDIVLVNTNFTDTNLSYQVRFSQFANIQPVETTPDPYAVEPIVQFSVPVFDVITGQETTNAVYLVDSGAALSNTTVALYTNTAWLSKYERPDYFALTIRTPAEWASAQPSNDVADVPNLPLLIYPGFTNTYESMSVPYASASYGVQIGWNPEQVDGTFPISADIFGGFNDIPGPTNQPGQIDLEAGQMDLNDSRIRAEGFVTLLASNLVNHPTTGVDWGQANGTLGSTNGNLVISNFFPTSFDRVRGDVFAWAANWENVGTNALSTNNYIFHVLIVDQSLRGSFKPTVRNLALTGKSSVTIYDPLTVINQSLFETPNLTIASTVELSQNASTVESANMPMLKNLTVAAGGALIADNTLDLGLNLNLGQTSPVKRKYSINSITNYGAIEAVSPLLQSQYFENDGVVFAEASAFIDADTMNFGEALTNQPNETLTEGDLTLSSRIVQVTNSFLTNGLEQGGTLTVYATGYFGDGESGAPSATSNLFNYWEVMNGFNMPLKPTGGDLYGTEIRTVSSNYNVSDHIWAGIDYGLNPDGSVNILGYTNNQVIGHLILDRQSSGATLRFTGAGTKNAMYVDFLELDDYSYSDYRNGLIIDPNMKIYFADANADPLKLMEVFPGRLIWASNYWGPNSTIALTNTNGVACLINSGWEPYLFGNYNPASYPQFPGSCPILGDSGALRMYVISPFSGASAAAQQAWLSNCGPANVVGTNSFQTIMLSVTGSGSIGPELTAKQLALGSAEALTATPASGWVFKDWTASGVPPGSVTSSPVMKFTLLTNTVVTANFIPNPFTALAGIYNGLFYDTNAASSNTAGFFTLTLRASGTFSGRLMIGPTTYTFSSQFPGSGYQQVKAVSGKQSLTVTLQLDLSGASGQIVGDVNGGSWDSALSANLTPAWTAKNPSPYAGNYTMAIIPGDTSTMGDSYGVVKVSKLGAVSVTGKLADGVIFNRATSISTNGQLPFYTYAPGGKDTVMGWVDFNAADNPAGEFSGNYILWSKAPTKGRYYGSGFESVNQIIGSIYEAPAKNTPALDLVGPYITLSGGGLSDTIANAVPSKNNLSYVSGSITLTINPSTGVFSGRIGLGKPAVSGVVLQKQNSARGFFLGTSESGDVLLQGN